MRVTLLKKNNSFSSVLSLLYERIVKFMNMVKQV